MAVAGYGDLVFEHTTDNDIVKSLIAFAWFMSAFHQHGYAASFTLEKQSKSLIEYIAPCSCTADE